MADRTNRRALPDLGASSPDRIRNVVLVGPAGSGKTTLVETLLAVAGATSRADRAHGRTISLAVTPLVSEGTKINLIDTPGYADFVGDLRAGLRAADCALFVIAANEGVDESTRTLWRECASVGMPRAVVVTKLDQARADYDGLLGQARAAFGDRVLPLFVPLRERRRGRRAHRAARADVGGRGDRTARRPDRGGHRGVRGRDPDGALRRGRGDRREGAARRPRARRRARHVLPRRTRVLADRRRLCRAARPRRTRLPVAGRAPLPRGLPARPVPRPPPSPPTPTACWWPRS